MIDVSALFLSQTVKGTAYAFPYSLAEAVGFG
jgi:hypothetical protein